MDIQCGLPVYRHLGLGERRSPHHDLAIVMCEDVPYAVSMLSLSNKKHVFG